MVQPLWKTVWNSLKKLKTELPFDPVIPLLGLYTKNSETPIQKNLCTPMFIAAQFTIAKCQKQPKCPSSVDEWIKNCGTVTQWNTTQQKEGTPTLVTEWMELETIMLSEISQVVKYKHQ